MKESPLVSVIVPVFNVAKYLDCCLGSLIKQTYRNFEALIIDDGSTDGSSVLCDNYQMMDSRFYVIHKANGGLSSARNTGLDVANGDYICFLDSDDYLEDDFLETLVSHINNSDYDFVSCCANFVDDSNNFLKRNEYDKKMFEISGNELFDVYMRSNYIEDAVWNKIYRKELFASNRFVNGLVFEDSEIIIRLLKKCKKVLFLREFKYNYRLREASIMSDVFEQTTSRQFNMRKLDLLKVYELISDELNGNKWRNSYIKRIVLTCSEFNTQIIGLTKSSYKEVSAIIKRDYRKYRKQLDRASFSAKEKAVIFIKMYLPRFYVLYKMVINQ